MSVPDTAGGLSARETTVVPWFRSRVSMAAAAHAPTCTLFGIAVSFDLASVLGTALAIWTFADVVLPAAAPGRSALAYWTGGAAAALLVLMSIVVHELGHALAARRAGVPARRMVISLFGGTTELVAPPRSPGAAFAIAVAGPLANLGLALGAAVIHVALVESGADALAATIPALAAVANLAIAALNALPGLPLDGGHILAAAVWRIGGNAAHATRAATLAGRVLGIALMAIALIGSASGDAGLALWFTLIGATIWLHADRSGESRGAPREPETGPGLPRDRRAWGVKGARRGPLCPADHRAKAA